MYKINMAHNDSKLSKYDAYSDNRFLLELLFLNKSGIFPLKILTPLLHYYNRVNFL